MRENLKDARRAAGMTQQQVADYLGLSLIGYSQIENGKRIGRIETWDKLEDLFNIYQRVLRENFSGKGISVDIGTRACINCIWCEQYYRQNRGNVAGWVPTSTGYCLRHDQQCVAMRQPCRDFKTKENNECK